MSYVLYSVIIYPFTGNSISNEAKEEPLYITFSLSSQPEGPNEPELLVDPKRDYYVKDNIFIPSNWIKADSIK